ncbi:MAG: hypothetical protein ACOX9E_13280 [Lentisphaeria bacterium]
MVVISDEQRAKLQLSLPAPRKLAAATAFDPWTDQQRQVEIRDGLLQLPTFSCSLLVCLQ